MLARPRGQKGLGLARARTRARARNGVRSPSWQVAEQGLVACGSRRPRPGACGRCLGFTAELGPLGPRGAVLGPARVAAEDADVAPISLRYRSDLVALHPSALHPSGARAGVQVAAAHGGVAGLTVPPWRRHGLLPRPPGRHGLRPGLPCVPSSHASRPFMCAAVALRAQVAHSAPLNAQAALLATALGRGGEATARFEACRRVDPFRAAYYDHSMVRA